MAMVTQSYSTTDISHRLVEQVEQWIRLYRCWFFVVENMLMFPGNRSPHCREGGLEGTFHQGSWRPIRSPASNRRMSLRPCRSSASISKNACWNWSLQRRKNLSAEEPFCCRCRSRTELNQAISTFSKLSAVREHKIHMYIYIYIYIYVKATIYIYIYYIYIWYSDDI